MLECTLPLCFHTLIPNSTDLFSVRTWGYFCPAYVRCNSVSVLDGTGRYIFSGFSQHTAMVFLPPVISCRPLLYWYLLDSSPWCWWSQLIPDPPMPVVDLIVWRLAHCNSHMNPVSVITINSLSICTKLTANIGITLITSIIASGILKT